MTDTISIGGPEGTTYALAGLAGAVTEWKQIENFASGTVVFILNFFTRASGVGLNSSGAKLITTTRLNA